MASKYQFEFEHMEFSKDGSLDELIALDRYTVPTYDGYLLGDTVVAIIDEVTQAKKVCDIEEFDHREDDVYLTLKDRLGVSYEVRKSLTHKPVELKPAQMWTRWAWAGASVELTSEAKEFWENEFRWLVDGFRYSLGGRIQLMLGQEYITGQRANLTAYNCFVARSPRRKDNPLEQFLEVLDVAFYEASIMRRGGGVGLNIGGINTVKGSGMIAQQFVFYLDKSHKDHKEFLQRIKLNKFKNVITVDTYEEYFKLVNGGVDIKAKDSVDEMFLENMRDLVTEAYNGANVIGIDFNQLRERNALVKSLNARSSGAISWMEFFTLIASILQLEQIDNIDFAEIFSSVVHLIIQG
jgi:ribonucleotide reductase alpha subunit